MKSLDLRHLAISFILLLGAPSALALPEDRDQAIKVVSENLHSNGKQVSVYSGNVVITQGSLQIQADKVEVHSNGGGSFDRVIATGAPVRFQQQVLGSINPLKGRARRVEFIVAVDTLQLTGEAHVDRDGNTLSAERIDYNLVSEQLKARSKTGEKRVEMIWQPEQKPTQQPDADAKQETSP